MTLVLHCLGALLAVYLSWQDWRHQSIPLMSLIAWLFVCGLLLLYKDGSYLSFFVLFFTAQFIGCYQYYRQKKIVASADLIVLVSCSAWIHDAGQLPLFLILCGTLGMVTAVIFRTKKIPFLPAIFLSSALILFFQTY